MRAIRATLLAFLCFQISISVVGANGDLSVSGAIITDDLFIDKNCSAGTNGGVLSTDALGEVICSNATVLPADESSCVSGGVPGTVVSGFGAGGVFRVSCFRRSVTTLAGNSSGFAEGAGAAAQFNQPTGVALDGAGNIYVADAFNHRIRKVTPWGIVSTLAGSDTQGYLDATGVAAQFNTPRDVAVDGAGNVYVADTSNNRIRKVTPEGVVSTLAGSTEGSSDGLGSAAQFSSPTGVAVDGAGNVYVADQGNHKVRKVTAAGLVSTLAGSTQGYADDIGSAAKFRFPAGLALDGDGNVLVADKSNHVIRKVTTSGFVLVTTLAGSGAMGFADGSSATAEFQFPVDVTVDEADNIYVADQENYRVRKITPGDTVTTVAGRGDGGFVDGIGPNARFIPVGVAVDGAGSVIYVADGDTNHRLRRIR